MRIQALFCFLLVMLSAANAQALTIINNNIGGLYGTQLRLVSSVPSDQEVMSGPVDQVVLTFSKAVRADKSSIKIFDNFNTQLNDGTVLTNPTGNMAIKLENPLPPGKYRLKWQARCACPEEEELSDIYHFTVK